VTSDATGDRVAAVRTFDGRELVVAFGQSLLEVADEAFFLMGAEQGLLDLAWCTAFRTPSTAASTPTPGRGRAVHDLVREEMPNACS